MDAMAESTRASSEVNAPPDWGVVPFAVACARCGHDLHGRSEPTCPACALTFRWADAVPIEHLQCASCGYHLYGLKDPRCPECGKEFTWNEALANYHRQRKPLFEYQWRKQPVRSLFRTWRLALRPKKLWATVEIHDPVQLGALSASALLFVLALNMIILGSLASLLSLKAIASPPTAYLQMRGITIRDHIIGNLRWLVHLSPTYITIFGGYFALWFAGLTGGLLIFQQSMHRRRLRPMHVWRIAVFTSSAFWCGITMAIVVNFSIDTFFYVRGDIAILSVLIAGITIAHSLRSVAFAYRDYLRMDHPWAVALSAHLIALLFTVTIAIPLMPSDIGSWILIELSKLVG